MDAGNIIRIVFTDAVELLSDVGGAFYLAGGFNENKINTDGTDTEIEFAIPTNEKLVVSIKADPIAVPDPVTVQKNGAITNGTSIEWKIIVNKENVNVNNAVLIDAIPLSQELDESSIKINGVTPTAGVTFVNNTLSVSLGDITTQQEITFVTSLTEDALLAALDAGDTSIPVINNATLEHDDNKTTNADSPKTVSIPLNILSKLGSYQSATTVNNTKNIKWTVVVNEDKLAFNNAVINDTLPAGLTFIAGSATIIGSSGVTPTVSGSDITFNLGNITDKVTITYETEIDPAKFKANGYTNFKNEAVLSWDGLTGTGVTKDATVGVGSSLFVKSGAGYNRSNGVISWSISINNDNINLAAPTITDIIPAAQKYIEGSAKIVDHQGNAYSNGSFNYDAGTSKLSYTFSSAINSKYTITFDSKPVSPNNITANQSGQFSNTATFTSGAINISSTGTQGYSSNVFKKDQVGYDKDTRLITWKFTVYENGATTPSSNSTVTDPSLYNAIPLVNVVIEDAIPAGLEYAGNFSIKEQGGADASSLVTVTEVNGLLTITFNQPITKQYVITFDTEINDESKFISQNNTLNNGNFNVNNEAKLTHNQITLEIKDSATQEIKNHIVSKKGIPTAYGNKYVDWVVYLNSNAVNLNQLLNVDKFWLIDNLQAGLELDTTSVALIQYSGAIEVPNAIPTNGDDGLGAGTNIPLDGTHIKYDAATREFRLNLPVATIDKAYKLSFRTYVTETVTSGTQFSNSINLFGSKNGTPVSIENAYQSGESRQVSFLEAGSMGYGSLGKFVVNKVDLENTSKKLSGATFALYDRFGNKVQEKTTVDGILEFNRIKSDLTYYIKEVEAPVGYLLSGNVSIDGNAATVTSAGDVVEDALEVKLSSVLNQKSVELTFKNEEIKANIQFTKQDETNASLAGAQFGLYTRGAAVGTTPIATATSLATGVVSFTNVPYGLYDIRELIAPAGYLTLTGVIHHVDVTEADHGTTKTLTAVSNELIRADIAFVKKNSAGAGIAGAEFSLYDSADQFVAKAVSKANGTVEFNDILAGQYTILETKAPFGYMPLTGVVKSVEVKEEHHSTTIDLGDVTNVLIQSNIEFVKNNEKNQPLAGATFGLYNSLDGEVQRTTTGADGKVTFTNVGEGTYTIEEISTPYGYKLIDGVIYTVTITDGDQGITKLLNPVTNTLIEANIEFVKVSEKGKALAGAEFVLLDVNNNDQLVQTSISGADGKVIFVDVGEGEYVIREKTAPVGYNPLTGDVATVEIIAPKHNSTVTLPDVTNQIIKGDVEFTKVAKSGGKPLKNARFALYAADDVAFDNEIATAISDDNGLVQFADVEYGDYTIVEIAAPSGYYRSKDTLSVSIRDEGGIYPLGNFENQKIPDDFVEGSIEINKVNTLGAPLAGAKFGLYDVMDKLIAQAVSNDFGIVRFTDVGEGVYTVKELEAPINYVESEQVEDVTIASGQNYWKLTFVNERSDDAPWPSVSVQKVDDAGKALAGVKFALYTETDTAFTTPVANSVTNASGIATFTNVTPGKYVVKEIAALEGYILSNVMLPITVTDEAKIHDAGKVENRVIRGDIVVTKVNELNESLQGAKFGLYDKDNKLVQAEVSNSDGIASFKDIPYGSYNLKELTAPESYVKSDVVIAINITIDGVVKAFTIVNEKVDDTGVTPGTGSNKPDVPTENGTGSNKPDSGTTESGIGSNKPGVNDGTTDGKDNAAGGANLSNQLPKTGDSISTMLWLFVGSGLLIVAYLLVARRKTQKQ